MTGRHDPGGAIHHRPEVVTLAALGVTAVDSHSHPERPGRSPLLLIQGALAIDGRGDAIGDRVEDRDQPVASGLQHRAPGPAYGPVEDLVMAGERGGHGVTVLFPETRASLDVGEEESLHRPGI